MVTNPTPPPSIEEVRDEAAEKYGNPQGVFDYSDGDMVCAFKDGWDSALRHLAQAAGGEFDAMAADKEAQEHVIGFPDATGQEQLLILHKFIAGARYQHARSWAKIQELEAEVELLRKARNKLYDDMAKGGAEDNKIILELSAEVERLKGCLK